MRLIFLGAPGAGKGTQADMTSETLNIPQISTGDILRQAVKDETNVGKKAKQYLDSGQLVPDDVIMEIMKDRFQQSDCKNGYILDGFPRTLVQAQGLDNVLSDTGHIINHVVYIDIDEEVIVKRLSSRRVCRSCGNIYNLLTLVPREEDKCDDCGGELYQRSDDREETIRQRMQVFQKSTEPLIEYYKKQDKLRIIDGSKPIREVQKAILDALQNN